MALSKRLSQSGSTRVSIANRFPPFTWLARLLKPPNFQCANDLECQPLSPLGESEWVRKKARKTSSWPPLGQVIEMPSVN